MQSIISDDVSAQNKGSRFQISMKIKDFTMNKSI